MRPPAYPSRNPTVYAEKPSAIRSILSESDVIRTSKPSARSSRKSVHGTKNANATVSLQPSAIAYGNQRRVSSCSRKSTSSMVLPMNEQSERRAVAYVRVSSKRQAEEGISIEAQIAGVKQYAILRNLDLADEDIFVDEGVSASTHLFSRQQGQNMHRVIYGQGVKHIISAKMDRLFRDVQDMLSTIDEMDRIGVSMHVIEYNGTMIDTSSPTGRFFITVIGGMSELERGLISERTKTAMTHMKANCKVFCHDIFGWNKVGKDLVPNWNEQDAIDFMKWAYHKQEKSSTWIAKHLNEKGITGKRGGTWKASMVLRTMRYEFHAQRELFEKPSDWGSSKWHDAVPFQSN